MRTRVLITLMIAGIGSGAFASSGDGESPDVSFRSDLDRLGSPYAAVRYEAYARLLRGDAGVDGFLARHYADADFRIKVLILDLLGERESDAGVAAVRADFESPSRAVREAQDRYLALLGDRVRVELVGLTKTGQPPARRRARSALAMLVRLQVEGVLLKKAREPALMYRDQFRVLRRDRELAVDALLRIISDGDRGYRFASKVTARVDMHEIRELAMDAIADVGVPEDADRLRKVHDEMDGRRRQKDLEVIRLEGELDTARDRDEWNEVRRLRAKQESVINESEMIERHLEHVQSALFRLGDPEPIDRRIAELEEEVGESRRDYEVRFELAMAYTRRESYKAAEEIYRNIAESPSYWRGISTYNLACVLSLQGRTKEALEALYDAIERHWSEAIGHAFEDGDLANVRKAYPKLRELLDAKQKEVEARGIERFFR